LELSKAEEKHGDSRDASEHLGRALDVAERLKSGSIPQILRTMADVRTQTDDYSVAADLYRRAIKVFRNTGDIWAAAGTLSDLGATYARLGDRTQRRSDVTKSP